MSADASALESTLRHELEGEVRFDAFTRGRYSTDASIYQIEPVGVVLPATAEDVVRALQIAADAGVAVVPRGAGTSQSGQAIGAALVVDTSKYLTRIEEVDAESRAIAVGPGVVLDRLNARLRARDLWFPVDVSTSAQATIGGMAGNNSAGTRSIRYGLMVDNVESIDAVLADGERVTFGPGAAASPWAGRVGMTRASELAAAMRAITAEHGDAIRARTPDVLRNVAGYNLHRLLAPEGGAAASGDDHRTGSSDLTPLLVGSEGTLAFFTRLRLRLQPVPFHRVLGVCHFPSLHAALDSAQHVVRLRPSAVELVDRPMLDLARDIASFERAIGRFVSGTPAALLLVEFSADDPEGNRQALVDLEAMLGDLGHAGAVVPAVDPAFQAEIWGVRKAALNIVMSMRGDGKPVSFIEDCAVPLEHLAEYADRLTEIFARHGTSGTWYAHASVGCLHVRPILNLKLDGEVRAMRAIAEECHDLVRRFRGSHSGEHGDGLVRSEFLAPMLGPRVVEAFERVKSAFDPDGVLNPGKIVRPPRMDDRSIMRYRPGYTVETRDWALDWSRWGGFGGAVEMCNNNGACRKTSPGVMCPSYRVTHDEQHTTRGRANSLRLAITGQLGLDALTSDAMAEAMDLCVGCKACRRECPTGVDMARMKIEFLHHRRRRVGTRLLDRLIGYLPRYAPAAARLRGIVDAPAGNRLVARLLERTVGLSARRRLPSWRPDGFRASEVAPAQESAAQEAPSQQEPSQEAPSREAPSREAPAPEVALFVDTFTTYFEPENARAAVDVLRAFGYRVSVAAPAGSARPLCCGRTFLNVGMLDEARVEARRTLSALTPLARRGVPILGLEPSCLLTLRDELLALVPGPDASIVAEHASLVDEFLTARVLDGLAVPDLRPLPVSTVLVHGHCHQKAFGIAGSTPTLLRWIPDLDVRPVESGCCGMAGSFGYEASHYDISMRMAELDLLPAVRAAGDDAWIAASGTSCRHQIADGAGRDAVHPVCLLALSLPAGASSAGS